MNTDKATLPVIQCMRPDLPEVRSHINEPSLTHRQDISINRNAFLSEKDLCLSLKNLGLDIASDEQKTNKTLKPLNDLIRLTNLALNALSSSVFLCLITPNNHKTQGLKNILYFLISLKKTQHSVKHNQAILEDLFKMVIGTSVIPRGIFKSYTNAGKAIVRALNEPKYAYFKEVIRPNAAKIRYADLFDFIAQTPKDISHESYRISMYAQTTALWCSENTRGAFVREIARHGIDSVINLRKQSMNRLQYKGPYRDVKFN